MADLISDPKTLFAVQQADDIPFNVGDGELISFPEGWIVKAAARSWLVMPANKNDMLTVGPIRFAIHPDYVHLASGGDGSIEGRVKKGGRDYLRVLAGGKVWWVSEDPPIVGTGVFAQPDMKNAFFFNQGGQRLYLRVISIIKKS